MQQKKWGGEHSHHDGVGQLGEKVRLVLLHVVDIHDLAELVDGLEIKVLPPQVEDFVAEELLGGEPVRERPVAPREVVSRSNVWAGGRSGWIQSTANSASPTTTHILTGAARSSVAWGGTIKPQPNDLSYDVLCERGFHSFGETMDNDILDQVGSTR